MHVLALAQRGYAATGADLSRAMVQRARENAAREGVGARFEQVAFGELAGAFGREAFDAVLCLGNSLPHVQDGAELAGALGDFAACLRPGGLLVIQNRNFDAVLSRQERWMEPQSHQEGGREWLFLRFYDFDPDGKITFNIMNLKREAGGAWQQTILATRLYPLLQGELAKAIEAAGFERLAFYGALTGAPFEVGSSGNLVITAKRW
jgi:SAM-dependent methyltransferase